MTCRPSWIAAELRNSLRSMRRSPGLVFSSVLALGLGIGASTTMFGIVRGGTRSLPVPDPGQIVLVSPIATSSGAEDTLQIAGRPS